MLLLLLRDCAESMTWLLQQLVLLLASCWLLLLLLLVRLRVTFTC